MTSLQSRLILSLVLVLAYVPPGTQFWRRKAEVEKRSFVVPAAERVVAQAPDFQTEVITPEAFVPNVHVASLCEAPDGNLCAAWYGGSHEGARDVNIYGSIRAPGPDKSWSQPKALVSRTSAAQELRRPIKKVGNAVLFAEPTGEMRLIYVTVSLGGWSTSSLNLKTSPDGGKTWRQSERLTLSPFFNFSELVKNQPSALSDGGWAVPIYHECLAKFPEILWLKEMPGGELSWSKTRLFGGRTALQPALIPLSPNTALALCRDCSPARQMRLTHSADAGRTWSPPQPVALPNSDSGLDAVRLFDGRLLLAFNDSASGRETLRLALSEDQGLTWSRRAILEAEPGEEFSYPYLIQTKDSRIHLVYTWKRKSIKHAVFNLAWVEAQPKQIPPGTSPQTASLGLPDLGKP